MIRVVLSGVESTGKSRLAAWLEQSMGAATVPEYGRHYTEALDRPLTMADHRTIAAGHRARADAVAARLPALMVEDTDIVMTTAWASMILGGRDPVLAAIPSVGDLHLLLLPDVPFVDDPVRMFGAANQRLAFHRIVVAEFVARDLPFTPIAGDWAARQRRALAAIAAFAA